MKKIKTIGILGGYGVKNFGDEAILAQILNSLYQYFKNQEKGADINFVIYSYDSKFTLDTIKFKNISVIQLPHTYFSIHFFPRIIMSLLKIDLFIIGGGSVIYDRILPLLSSVILFLKILRKKIMCYSIGMSHVRSLQGRLLAKYVLNLIDIMTFRDYLAFNHSKSLSITRPLIEITADPAFSFFPRKKLNFKILQSELNNGSPLVGFCVRGWYGMGDSEEIFKRINKIIQEIIRFLIKEKKFKIIFIPLSFNVKSDDRQAAYELVSNLDSFLLKNITILDSEYNPEEIAELLGEMDMVISMRLHSLIFSAIQGIPIIGLNYDPKVKGFMEYISLKENLIESDFSISKSLEIVKVTWERRIKISSFLKNKSKILREKTKRDVFLAVSLLK